MFSGQLKRERRVNLKGASAIESREDVLRRAKQERAKRQSDLRAANAALKIQAWLRAQRDLRRARRELQVRWRLPTHGDFWTRVKELCFFFDAKDADCVRKLGQLCEGWAEYSARGVEVASTAALLKVVLSFLEEQLDACSTILLATPSAGSASEDATVDHADVRMCVDGVPTPADVRAAASAAVTCARDIVAGASGRPENDRFAPSVLLWSCKSWVGPFDSRRRPALAYLCAILRRLAMGVDGVGGAKSQAEARQGTALESLAVAWVAGLVEACKVLPPAAAERGVAVESLMGLLRVPRLLDVCPALRSEASVDLWVALLGSPAPLRADGGTPRVVLRNLLALSAVALPHVHARLAESIRDLQSRRARVVQRTGSLARSSMDLAEDSAAHSELVAVSVRAGARLCNALVTLEVAALQKGPGDDGGAVGAAISDLDQPGLLKPLIQVCLWPGWMATCADLAAEGSDLPRADHQAVQHLCEALLFAWARQDPARGNVLRTLAFSTNLVPALWGHYLRPCQCHPSAWHEAAAQPLARARGDPGDLLPLTLLSHVFSIGLIVCSEQDLRVRGKPLAPADLFSEMPGREGLRAQRGLVPMLRDALTRLLWSEPSAPSTGVEGAPQCLRAAAQGACGRLYAQLYSRHLREPLAPQAAFHTGQIPGEALVRDAVAIANADSYDDSDDEGVGPSGQGLAGDASLAWTPLVAAAEGVQQGRWAGMPRSAEAGGSALDGRGVPRHGAGGGRVWKLLRVAPYLVAFMERALAFSEVVRHDRERHRRGWAGPMGDGRFVRVRRDHLIADAFAGLNLSGEGLKRQLRVMFVDQHGLEEAGVDGGGLFKDFLEGLMKAALQPDAGLFSSTADHRVYPAFSGSSGWEPGNHFRLLSFLGRMLGKAVYEGILMELPLAGFLLKKFRGEVCDLEDLPSLDPELHRNLAFLQEYRLTGDVEELSLTFSVEVDAQGEKRVVDLVPNGREVPVTNDNVVRYVHLMAHWKLNVQCRRECEALLGGFFEVIDSRWISMFAGQEIQMLISGVETDGGWAVEDLRRHVVYGAGYADDHPIIHNFWEALSSFTPHEQGLLLKFVTSCSRPPLLGFGYLEPRMGIQMAGHVGDRDAVHRLPTAATCMNLLKLPPYPSTAIMRDKLLYAIRSGAGFDLS